MLLDPALPSKVYTERPSVWIEDETDAAGPLGFPSPKIQKATLEEARLTSRPSRRPRILCLAPAPGNKHSCGQGRGAS